MSYSLGLLVICVIAMVTASPVKEEEKTEEKRGYNCRSKCELNGQCIDVGQTHRDGCRSLRCTSERRGSWTYYRLQPTGRDQCDFNGRCVPKDVPFEMEKCQMYICRTKPNGGWSIRPYGQTKCQDYRGNCVSPGSTFSKYGSNGHLYNNCQCYPGGGYRCRGTQ